MEDSGKIYFILEKKDEDGSVIIANLKAKEYSEKYPNNKIFANYQIDLPNFNYTKFGFVPFSEFHDCLIIINNFGLARSVLSDYVEYIFSEHKKQRVSLIMIGGYYDTFSNEEFGKECTFIHSMLDLENNLLSYFKSPNLVLRSYEITEQSNCGEFRCNNLAKKMKKVYNNLIESKTFNMDFLNENEMLEDIVSKSHSEKELHHNTCMWKKDFNEQQSLFNIIKRSNHTFD